MYSNESTTQERPAKVRLCGLWKERINEGTILTGGLCAGIRLVLIPMNSQPGSRQPNAFLYSVTKDMLNAAKEAGIDENSFKGHRVTGLWLMECSNGKYYAGDWEPDTSLFVFRNTNRQEERNQPHYEVFIVPKPRKSPSESIDDGLGDNPEEEGAEAMQNGQDDCSWLYDTDSSDAFAGLNFE